MDRPHARDVRERETADAGFSRGWGEHFQPCERYWIDCHTHMREETSDAIGAVIEPWHERLEAWRLRRHLAMDGNPEHADDFGAVAQADDRFRWLVWMDHDEPDLANLETCLSAGASGLKLHNAPVIRSGTDPTVWHRDGWHDVFERMAAADKPVLWHVTQRLTDSPYTGGGRHSYWSDGWEAGVEYTNEDLLQSFLAVVDEHPNTDFIGAHQLHLGFDRLHALLRNHPNLHFDTSIGWFVRWGDRLHPEDRDRARSFAMEWSDRILFGTDCVLGSELMGEYVYQQFLGHVRYLRQLQLSHEPLQAISHRNAERLFGFDSMDVPRKGALRP